MIGFQATGPECNGMQNTFMYASAGSTAACNFVTIQDMSLESKAPKVCSRPFQAQHDFTACLHVLG